ncbi:hypothetical protein [Gordonia insulae]|uniref:Uncharacterized protein n=1 Tax=Gordonia insulae TaxID=2420509 RepID=A0A3G8JRQ3_9ACTN|nr:hypothetical protein [Gordonia insulae]AZG47608.1 hypothetical protein D7316_04220 [Gordonia insulae]
MRRNILVRISVILAAFAVVAFTAPAVADASPPRPGATPVVGAAKGVGFSVQVTGRQIKYTVTDVPRSSIISRGFCSTAVVDVIKAAPIIGPSLISLIQGGPVDVVKLLTDLAEADAVTASHLARFATSAAPNTVTGTFDDIPNGLYAILTVCNLDPDLYGVTGAFVLGEGLNYGSSA